MYNKFCILFLDFERHDDDELGFRKNDIITIISRKDEHCWVGELNSLRGKIIVDNLKKFIIKINNCNLKDGFLQNLWNFWMKEVNNIALLVMILYLKQLQIWLEEHFALQSNKF